MINQEQMDNNWKELMSIIDEHFEGEQKENILKLHSDFEDEYKTAPASGRPNYHNCFKGGYLDHVLHVIKNSLMIKKLFYGFHQSSFFYFTYTTQFFPFFCFFFRPHIIYLLLLCTFF